MKNLIFYNKEGYPYNFEYNEENKYYEGKLFFDENSNDTYKTLCIYAFEEVDAFNFTLNDANLIKNEFYNYSGISFLSADVVDYYDISNIKSVNSSPDFYSKWIYGNSFDDFFPIGTIISFSGVTIVDNSNNIVNIPDYQDNYYVVLDNKPNSILITTKTDNYTYNYNFSGGTIRKHNIVKLNDYENIDLSNIYENKKLSIIGSDFNDSVVKVLNTAQTYTYFQTYELSATTGDTLKVNLELFTERPKLYQGLVDFIISGSTAQLYFHKKLNNQLYLEKNDQFIFEDYNDNPILPSNPIFTITDGISALTMYTGGVNFIKDINTQSTLFRHFKQDKKLSSVKFIERTSYADFTLNKSTYSEQYPTKFFNYDYTLELSGNSILFNQDFSIGDTILLESTSTDSKNNNRKLKIKDILLYKDWKIDEYKNKLSSTNGWMIKIKSSAIRNNRLVEDELELEAINLYNNNENNTSSPNYVPSTLRTIKLVVDEYIIEESNINTYTIKKVLSGNNIQTLNCSLSTTIPYSAFTMDVVAYDTSNIIEMTQTFLSNTSTVDYTLTLSSFTNKYQNTLDKYGLIIYYEDDKLKISSNYIMNGDEDKYFTPYVYVNDTEILLTGITNSLINNYLFDVDSALTNEIHPVNSVNNISTYQVNIIFDIVDNNNNYGFNLEINDINYYVNFSSDTQTTINNFIILYDSILNDNGFDVYSGITSGNTLSGYTLIFQTIYPNVNVNSLNVIVNKRSNYEIYNISENNGIILSANMITTNNNLYDYGLSTGMIISVTGSTYNQNNKEYNIIGLSENIIELSYQGIFFNDTPSELIIDVKEFIRKPRESYNKDVYYSFKWDEITTETDYKYRLNDIFYYDFTGEHLKPYNNNENLKYTGTLPLWDVNKVCDSNFSIRLIDEPNKDVEFVNEPTKQQTVFNGEDGNYCLNFLLDKYNSTDEFNFIPEPLQVFIGFKSNYEGVSRKTLIMDKYENIILSGYTSSNINFELNEDGLLKTQNLNFINYGFEKNQLITIDFIEQVSTGNTIFNNYGNFEIEYVTSNKMKLKNDNTIKYFNTSGSTSGYLYKITVQPKTLLKINLYGQTENEDERYNILLNNLGIELNEDVEHIFKESDINEDGYDYILLNAKRKEMLSMYPHIYDYIGSYKSLINAINFFGWNDLGVYEYYKNFNPNSPLYQKLNRVKVQNLFDNTIDGWMEDDYIKGKYDKGYWKKTNLFNLSYNITDEEGNYTLLYSIDEVQVKLNKLKRWLRKNILPISTNIMDITGIADSVSQNYYEFDTHVHVSKYNVTDESTSINFTISKTQNFNDNYLVEVRYYTRNDFIPSGWTSKIKTFSIDGNKLIPQKYFKLFKNDLESFTFNIDDNVDKYIYIETEYFNDYGLSMKYSNMMNLSTNKTYLLVTNNFNIPNYNYLNVGDSYYYFDDLGYIYINE